MKKKNLILFMAVALWAIANYTIYTSIQCCVLFITYLTLDLRSWCSWVIELCSVDRHSPIHDCNSQLYLFSLFIEFGYVSTRLIQTSCDFLNILSFESWFGFSIQIFTLRLQFLLHILCHCFKDLWLFPTKNGKHFLSKIKWIRGKEND